MAWEPVIKETHWFGVYEYVDYPYGFNSRTINWSGNYIQSIEIVKSATGQDPRQQPITSYYSWLDHQLRFSVDNTDAWGIDATNNSAYNLGQGLKNTSWDNQNFNIHNLKAGDSYTIKYYENNSGSATEITGSATGTATISIPAQAVIRCVVITLAEYQKAETKVRELTQTEQSQLGGFGYRYSFNGSGVLEDKRGAVPYITMKFGNDNDMTFVRSLADVTYSYGSLKQVTPKMFTKNGGQTDGVASTPDENGVYVVHSIENPSTAWDTQFWIGTSEYSLPAGQKFKIKFDYRSDAVATANTQTHGSSPGSYIHWACIGDLNFTTEWQTFEQEITIEDNMAGWQSVAFNLNVLTSANNYYFRNIELSIPERTENISDANFGAASIIDASNNLDPATNNYDYLQYRLTYKETNNVNSKFTEDEIRNSYIGLVGKEWSTFTAQHDLTVDAGSPDPKEDMSIVYGDLFNTIWPLCGNFFYFFPEVDGKLVIEYYCEGSNETPAFWYKQKADGSYPGVGQQPAVTHHNLNNDNRTNGTNNYWMEVNVEKGGIYYLCSLPTNISHEHPILRLKSYSFIPRFRVDPLYKVVDNVTAKNNSSNDIKYAAEIYGGPYSGMNTSNLTGTYTRNAEQEPRVKCLGNVASAKVKVFEEGGKQYLGFEDITFKAAPANPGGAIVAFIDCPYGQASFVLTVAYDAAEAKMVDGERVPEASNGEEVKSWNFFSNEDWDLGKYVKDDGTRYADNPTAWKAKSKLFKEVHKADGLTADWVNTFVNLKDGEEPIFKSVYDMEADNADMIHETAGLVFHTHSNHLGIYNEDTYKNGNKTPFQDRFIGFMEDGQLVIPLLKEGDRIVIKMGCYGNVPGDDTETKTATLTITGAKDAVGNAITGDYKIGGSGANVKNGLENVEFEDQTKPYGEYHFISTGGDFTLEIKEADLLKIYSIAIYRNDVVNGKTIDSNDQVILTENSVAAEDDKRYILNVPENDAKDHAYLHINHRGENEPTKFHQEWRKTGNITAADIVPDASEPSNDMWYNYSVNNDKFGIFKTRLGVKTTDEAYVTDYADCMIPVGYRETLEYPYTWDFTDLKKYVSAGIDEDGVEKEVDEDDFKIWDEYGFRTNSEEYDGYIFAPGGQLYGGTTMFDETRGIGIFHNDVDNKTMTMTSEVKDEVDSKENGGLAVSDEFGFIVPQVAAGQAVYVHATASDGATAQYAIGNGAKQTLSKVGTNAYAMKMADDATTANVTLYFKGCEINKIAVSDFAKSVNKLGYASESRAEEIDPELMGYMTGTGLKAYTVSKVTYGDNAGDIPSIELKVVPSENVIGAATHHDHNAYIIYNTDAAVNDTKAVNALDGGFHLFVPDMHDKSTLGDEAKKSKLDVSGNGLRAWLPEDPATEVMCQTYTYTTGSNGSITAVGGSEGKKEYTTYALSSKGKNTVTGKTEENVERFRRVAAKVVVDEIAGVIAGNNKAYLPLLTTEVKPNDNVSGSKGMFAIVFVDEEEGTETTSLDGVESIERTYNDGSYYTLGGVKVQNPTKKGIYIKNGKKVVIK